MSARYRRFGPRVTISLAAVDHDKLNRLAAESEVSVSWMIRRAIGEFLRKQPQSRGLTRSTRSVHKREDAAVGGR